MAKQFHKLPSELLHIEREFGEYEAFCFDECCSYIISMINDENEPHFEEDRKKNSTLELLKAGKL